MIATLESQNGRVTECQLIARDGSDGQGSTEYLFYVSNERIAPNLDRYLIAPLEIFTDAEINEFCKRVHAARAEG